MAESRKEFILLEAYERQTNKETFCLSEENLEGVLEAQRKKASMIEELQRLKAKRVLSDKDKAEFDRRVKALIEQESENAETLERLMAENRNAAKKIAKKSASASKFRDVYGTSKHSKSAPRSLRDRA